MTHEMQVLIREMLACERARAWESGILFGSLLAAIGSFFSAYGSTYMRRLDYWHSARLIKS